MRITSRGTGLLTSAAVLLAAGFGFGYPELALLGATGVGAVACALLHALGQPRLHATRSVEPERVGRNEPATMTVTVRNRDRLRPANLVAQDRCAGRPVPVPVLRLRPGRDTSVSYPVPTHRRGVVSIGPLRVVRRDPLGLVRLARDHAGVAQVWVHPRIHPLSAVPAGAARSLDGRLDRVPQGSITFDSLREYVVGDELRRVHWRTSARVGQLMVREDVDTSLPRIVVLLDNRAEAHPQVVDGVAETFESACEAAASVVAAAVRDDLPVTLLMVVDGDDGVDHLDRLAAVTLHRTPRAKADPLRGTAARLRQQRPGDTLVFLTGPGGSDGLAYIAALRGAFPVVVVGIFGEPPVPAGIEGVLVLNAADAVQFAAEWDGIHRW